MAQAYSDGERLRNFAEQLRQFVSCIENESTFLNGRMSGLGNSWRDEHFERFCEDFARTRQMLTTFTEEVMRVIPKLHQDADTLDEYSKLGF